MAADPEGCNWACRSLPTSTVCWSSPQSDGVRRGVRLALVSLSVRLGQPQRFLSQTSS